MAIMLNRIAVALNRFVEPVEADSKQSLGLRTSLKERRFRSKEKQKLELVYSADEANGQENLFSMDNLPAEESLHPLLQLLTMVRRKKVLFSPAKAMQAYKNYIASSRKTGKGGRGVMVDDRC